MRFCKGFSLKTVFSFTKLRFRLLSCTIRGFISLWIGIMTAPMYTLLLLTLLIANFPFLTQRGFGIIALKRKRIMHHLVELLIGFFLVGAIAYVLESRSGSVHSQGWAFYVVVVCVYLVFAFPAFVWRYFWQGRNRE